MAAPNIEPFEQVKPGHRVVFSPRDAVGGARGLRKPITGRISNLDVTAGTVQVGSWLVPLSKVQRLSKDVYRDFSKAKRQEERQRVYGKLSPAEKRRLETCAKDARAASLYTCLSDSYGGPMDQRAYAAMKRCREKYMEQHGIMDTTDRGQCEALPRFLERALAEGKTPELRGVEYVSADTGAVGIGDTVSIGGHKFTIKSVTPDGKVRLKDGYDLEFPLETIPRDKAAPVTSVFRKLEKKRDERREKLRRTGLALALKQKHKPAAPIALKPKRPRKPIPKARRRHKRRTRRRFTPGTWTMHRSLSPATIGRFCSMKPGYRGKLKCRPQRQRLLSVSENPRNPRRGVVVESDLLGAKKARLEGPSGRAEQIPLFHRAHALTREERAARRETEAWRKRRDEERDEGQRDLFENPDREKTGGSGLALLALAAGTFCLYALAHPKTVQQPPGHANV